MSMHDVGLVRVHGERSSRTVCCATWPSSNSITIRRKRVVGLTLHHQLLWTTIIFLMDTGWITNPWDPTITIRLMKPTTILIIRIIIRSSLITILLLSSIWAALLQFIRRHRRKRPHHQTRKLGDGKVLKERIIRRASGRGLAITLERREASHPWRWSRSVGQLPTPGSAAVWTA